MKSASASGPVRPAKVFRAPANERLQRFYTGGPFSVSSDGRLLVTACADEAQVVELESGAVLKTLPGDSEPVTALGVTGDGKHVFTASRSLVTKKWCTETGKTLLSWKSHTAPVWDMAVDSTIGLLATASADRTVRVWDIGKGHCTHVFRGHRDVVLVCRFHPDSHRLQLFSAGNDYEVRVWDMVNNACTAVFKEHFSAVTSLAVSPCGWLLLSGGRDKMVMVWDLRTNKKVSGVPVFEAVEGLVTLPKKAELPGLPPESSAEWAKQQRQKAVYFATVGSKGTLRFWDSSSGNFVHSTVIAPDAEGDADAGMDAAANTLTGLQLLPESLGSGLMLSTGEAKLLVYGAESQEVKNGKIAGGMKMTKQLIGNNDEITDLRLISVPGEESISAEGEGVTHIAVASNSPAIHLFSAQNRSCTTSLEGHKDTVLCLDALHKKTADGTTRVLLASGSKDNTVRLWDCSGEGQLLATGKGHISAVSAVAFGCQKAKFVATGGADKLLKVWDIAPFTEQLQGTDSSTSKQAVSLRAIGAVAAHDKDINAVAVSPDDSLIVTASADKTARVWRMPDLIPALTLKGHKRGVWAASFSPVEKVAATASGDRTIRLWSLVDGACLKTFEGHTASVLRCCFIKGGTQILSSGADGLLKLWSVRTTECVNTFDEHEDRVWALTIAPKNDALVASGGGDAIINIWHDCTESEEAEEAEKHQLAMLQTQDLENALMYEEYDKAIKLAFKLRQPGKLLMVVNQVLEDSAHEDAHCSWRQQLGSLVADFDKDELKQALQYAQEWNTKSRSCIAAQAMLGAIFSQHPPSTLAEVPGISELLQGLGAYSGRHFKRITQMMRSTYLLDYILSSMNSVLPADGDDDATAPDPEDWIAKARDNAADAKMAAHTGGDDLDDDYLAEPLDDNDGSSEQEDDGEDMDGDTGDDEDDDEAAGAESDEMDDMQHEDQSEEDDRGEEHDDEDENEAASEDASSEEEVSVAAKYEKSARGKNGNFKKGNGEHVAGKKRANGKQSASQSSNGRGIQSNKRVKDGRMEAKNARKGKK